MARGTGSSQLALALSSGGYPISAVTSTRLLVSGQKSCLGIPKSISVRIVALEGQGCFSASKSSDTMTELSEPRRHGAMYNERAERLPSRSCLLECCLAYAWTTASMYYRSVQKNDRRSQQSGSSVSVLSACRRFAKKLDHTITRRLGISTSTVVGRTIWIRLRSKKHF